MTLQEQDPRIEEEGDGVADNGGLLEGLAAMLALAIKAMVIALAALILALATLLARALQAVFVLARPGALVGCVVAAGYTSVQLFVTVLAHYGNDLPAALLALSSIVIAPAALLVMAEDHDAERRAGPGVWAIMLAVAGVEFLAQKGIERAPPGVLALLPVLALAATIMHFLLADHLEETQEASNEQEREWFGTTLADHRSPHSIHSEPISPLNPEHIADR